MGDAITIELHLVEVGWLLPGLMKRAAAGDLVARSIYRKLKAGAVAAGAVWVYGDPWPMGEDEDQEDGT